MVKRLYSTRDRTGSKAIVARREYEHCAWMHIGRANEQAKQRTEYETGGRGTTIKAHRIAPSYARQKVAEQEWSATDWTEFRSERRKTRIGRGTGVIGIPKRECGPLLQGDEGKKRRAHSL